MAQALDDWKLTIYKGGHSKYKYEILAVKVQSNIIDGAEEVFLYDTFNLEFGKKVKPFMARLGSVSSSTEAEMHAKADSIIRAWRLCKDLEKKEADEQASITNELTQNNISRIKELAKNFIQLPYDCEMNGESKHIEDINGLIGSVVGDDEIKTYYENLVAYVKNNITEFAVRKLSKTPKQKKGEDQENSDEKKQELASGNENSEKQELAEKKETDVFELFKEYNGYSKNKHLGAFLIDKQYTEKYKVCKSSEAPENQSENFDDVSQNVNTSDSNTHEDTDTNVTTPEELLLKGCYPLALRVEQFKVLTDMSGGQYQVKDVVEAFVKKDYILCGNSKTVEKDLTLASGVQERCYIIDLGCIKDEQNEQNS